MPISDDDKSKDRLLLSPVNDKVHLENEKNSRKMSADLRLHDAVYDPENIEEIQDLIDEKPELAFEKDNEGRTPLHTLAIAGDEEGVEIAKIILGVQESTDGKIISVKRKEALNVPDDKGYTPLHVAATNWLPELTEAFLNFGANPSIRDLVGNTPLHYAAEGEVPNAIACAKTILNHNSDGSLIRSKNNGELTPMHMAVKEQAVGMVNLLLEKVHRFSLGESVTNSGETILHYLCEQMGETEKSSKIFEILLSHCSTPQFNMVDQNNRTPLHIAAMRKLPGIVNMLNNEAQMDVMKADKRGRTALMYAAENGAYPNGWKCVEILLARKFQKTEGDKIVQYLYKIMDNQGNSAFTLAALNCPPSTTEKFLTTIPQPQFWLGEIEMTLLYKHCPSALKGLMDSAFTEPDPRTKPDDDFNTIFIDYGPITGYKDPINQLHQPESKYLRNALWWEFPIQKEIMSHPLVQLYLAKKYEKLRPMIYGWIFWQVIWLAAYTILVYSVYTKELDNPVLTYISTFIILIYIIMSLLNEIFECISVGVVYALSWSNAFQLAQIILGVMAIYPVILGSTPSATSRNCAAMGILLAHILSLRDFGKLHESIGFVIEILKQVVFEILKVLLCCFMLVLGFTHAFKVIFDDEETLKSSFPGPLVKVLVMMTGEFEYNDTFNKEEGKEMEDNTTKLVLFLLFLICIPIACFNLITGVALDRVMELKERAKVGRLLKHLEHVCFIETMLLNLNLLKKFLSAELITNWLRKYNVTTAGFEGKLQFLTLQTEKARKCLDRRTAKQIKLDLFGQIKAWFTTDVDPSIRNEIYALASENSSGIRKQNEEIGTEKKRFQ